MKTMLSFWGVDEKDHSKEVVAALLRINPAGAKFSSHSFYANMEEGAPETNAVLKVLEQAGLRPWVSKNRMKQPEEYELNRYREYEDSDFEGLELMQVWPTTTMSVEWPSSSTMGVRHCEVKKSAKFAMGRQGVPIMVPDRIRRTLVSEEFRGLLFTPLKLLRNTRNPDDDAPEAPNWSSIGEPWWVVDSCITMPRLSPYLLRVNPNNGTINPREGPGIIREPGFDDVEFHYLRSELKQIPEFDVARYFETGGATPVIVNRRFYNYCKEHNLKCAFKPVRIDED